MAFTGDKKRKYQREWIKKRRQQWFDENGPCSICGAIDNLEIHHINPKEKITHNVWSWSKEKQEKELEKCIVVCNRCHKNITSNLRITPHGTLSRYKHRKCRCDLCKKANRDRSRKRRERIKNSYTP